MPNEIAASEFPILLYGTDRTTFSLGLSQNRSELFQKLSRHVPKLFQANGLYDNDLGRDVNVLKEEISSKNYHKNLHDLKVFLKPIIIYLSISNFRRYYLSRFRGFCSKSRKFVPVKYSVLLKPRKLIPAKKIEKNPRISRNFPPL